MKMMPITIHLNRIMRGMPRHPLGPLEPEDMNDEGTDALRLAIIERAIMDLKIGIIATNIMTSEKIAMAVTPQLLNRMYNYRHEAFRFMRSAREFLKSVWCDTLAMDTNVDYLVSETVFNSQRCSAMLKQPYDLYVIRNKVPIPFATVRECMDCTLLGLTAIMPPSLLGHIREDPETGIKTILFTRKAQRQPMIKYFGIERPWFGPGRWSPDAEALYARRVSLENNANYNERRIEDD